MSLTDISDHPGVIAILDQLDERYSLDPDGFESVLDRIEEVI